MKKLFFNIGIGLLALVVFCVVIFLLGIWQYVREHDMQRLSQEDLKQVFTQGDENLVKELQTIRQNGLLRTEGYRLLHWTDGKIRYEVEAYGLGWVLTKRSWAGGMAFQHTGSNTMNYANVWMAPQKNRAYLACVNQGDEVAFLSTDDAISWMIKSEMK